MQKFACFTFYISYASIITEKERKIVLFQHIPSKKITAVVIDYINSTAK